MERIKTISRGKSGAADTDTYRPELLADEEPRYLRRQKPVEIRRKKFAGRSWSFYRRVAILSVAGIAGVSVVVAGVRFLLYSPQLALAKPDQIDLSGNKIVSRESVLKQFVRDRNQSVLQIPWTSAAANWSSSPGSNPQAYSVFCQIAFASNYMNARLSRLRAAATNFI